MPQFSSSEDIYKELVVDSKENWIRNLLAFAVIEEQRMKWMRHYETHIGSQPTSEEITSWYRQQHEGVLEEADKTAGIALTIYSDKMLNIARVKQQREIEKSAIIQEIKVLKAFWPRLGISIVGGLIGAVLFSALLALAAFFVISDHSPIQIGLKLTELLLRGK